MRSELRKKYFSRRLSYQEGGPPEICFSVHHLISSDLKPEILAKLANDAEGRRLIQACLLEVFRSPTAHETTSPAHGELVLSRQVIKFKEILDLTDEQYLERARRHIPDNLILDASLAFLAENLELLDDRVVDALGELAETQIEHVTYVLTRRLVPKLAHLPEALQGHLLMIGLGEKIKHHHSIHPLIQAIIANYDALSTDQQQTARTVFDRILRLGWNEPQWPIIKSIKAGLDTKSFNCELLSDYPAVLRTLAWHGCEETRGLIGELWTGKSYNPYPELQDVYLKLKVDKHEFVRDCMDEGAGAAYHKHWWLR
ncbi:MAG: hypothetical protein K0U74_05410 [Alphaproteobacteria bacterium]|nr:hypothetical protein [Alphaproteobacteria bacterium]